MLPRILLIVAVFCTTAVAQTLSGLSVDSSVKNWDAGGLCPKAKDVLEANHTSRIVVEMYVNSAGKVDSFKIVSPKGLHLEKDPEIRKSFEKGLVFNPARVDGHAVLVLINMDFNCSFDPPSKSIEPTATH